MKKEKHVLYRLMMCGLWLLLAIGIVLLMLGLKMGPEAILLSRGTSI